MIWKKRGEPIRATDRSPDHQMTEEGQEVRGKGKPRTSDK